MLFFNLKEFVMNLRLKQIYVDIIKSIFKESGFIVRNEFDAV